MDPVQTEIMQNRFTAMAEEAATVAYRTAHTTFVKQTQDFQVALARTTGEFFAHPVMTGVTSTCGLSVHGLVQALAEEGFEPGKAFAPEDTVDVEPVDKRLESPWQRPVMSVTPRTTFADQARLTQRPQVLGDRRLRDAAVARQFSYGDFPGAHDLFVNLAPGGVGESAHDGGNLSGGHGFI